MPTFCQPFCKTQHYGLMSNRLQYSGGWGLLNATNKCYCDYYQPHWLLGCRIVHQPLLWRALGAAVRIAGSNQPPPHRAVLHAWRCAYNDQAVRRALLVDCAWRTRCAPCSRCAGRS
eukprot:364174-Chlamydomonas_euryale.AAC.3